MSKLDVPAGCPSRCLPAALHCCEQAAATPAAAAAGGGARPRTARSCLQHTARPLPAHLLLRSTSAFLQQMLEKRRPIPLMAVRAYMIFCLPSTLVLSTRRMCVKLSLPTRDCREGGRRGIECGGGRHRMLASGLHGAAGRLPDHCSMSKTILAAPPRQALPRRAEGMPERAPNAPPWFLAAPRPTRGPEGAEKRPSQAADAGHALLPRALYRRARTANEKMRFLQRGIEICVYTAVRQDVAGPSSLV